MLERLRERRERFDLTLNRPGVEDQLFREAFVKFARSPMKART